jgi:hypothetical protein
MLKRRKKNSGKVKTKRECFSAERMKRKCETNDRPNLIQTIFEELIIEICMKYKKFR